MIAVRAENAGAIDGLELREEASMLLCHDAFDARHVSSLTYPSVFGKILGQLHLPNNAPTIWDLAIHTSTLQNAAPVCSQASRSGILTQNAAAPRFSR